MRQTKRVQFRAESVLQRAVHRLRVEFRFPSEGVCSIRFSTGFHRDPEGIVRAAEEEQETIFASGFGG